MVTAIDILGPEVTPVSFGDANYNVLGGKPLSPTPLVSEMVLSFVDAILRAPGDIYPALDMSVALNPGQYRVVGDHVGNVVVSQVDVSQINPPQGAHAA